MEQRISGIEDTIEDMDTWSKKMLINVKKKNKKYKKPGTKHSGNLGHYHKTKSKNNRNR